jgi:hypothetical protein
MYKLTLPIHTRHLGSDLIVMKLMRWQALRYGLPFNFIKNIIKIKYLKVLG